MMDNVFVRLIIFICLCALTWVIAGVLELPDKFMKVLGIVLIIMFVLYAIRTLGMG